MDLDSTRHNTDFIPVQRLDGNDLSKSVFVFDFFAKALSTVKSGFSLHEGLVFLI